MITVHGWLTFIVVDWLMVKLVSCIILEIIYFCLSLGLGYPITLTILNKDLVQFC